ASPESTAAENSVIIAAENLTAEITRLSDGLDLIENQVLSDINIIVNNANDSITEIDRLNNLIVTEKSANRPTSALENSRDAEVQRLAEITKLRTFERDDGTLSVYTTSGLILVDSSPETFTWNEATRSLTISGSNSTNLLTSNKIPDGELGALANFIRTDSASISSGDAGDGTLEKIRNQLDELAFSLADNSTARTSGSVFVQDNTDLTGSGIITAGNTLTFTVGGVLQGTVTVAAGDSIETVLANINAVNQVSARVDGHGHLQILSDGGAFTIGGTAASEFGLTTSQVAADQDDTLAYAYEAERSQGGIPLTSATVMSSITGIAVGDSFNFNNTSLGGAVTYTVGAGDTVQTMLDAINSQDGMYARIGDGNVLEITSKAGGLTLNNVNNTPLTALGFTVNGSAASINGTATSSQSTSLFVAESGGSPLNVTRTNIALTTGLSNNTQTLRIGNRTEIIAALNSSNRSINGSGSTIANTDYTGLSNGILTGLAQRAERATLQAEESEGLRAGLNQALRDEVGVNIDEEMARLTVLQNAYAASARVIDVINQMFQALDAAAR
ncbi:MAG: flagellar basal body rod C-terminal domain-containing protein, partial [Alphaproteobacteria bacterium]|nr:flagellar basal body rod C-terminal domain-containing protein [Alphaproteobacteria bacterium]